MSTNTAEPKKINNTVKLSPPWLTFVNEVKAMFKNDPDIVGMYDDTDNVLRIMVDNPSKADALEKLLPGTVDFGNVKLKIMVIPSNEKESTIELLKRAFAGNDILKDAVTIETPFGPRNYVVFKKEIAQFFNDDLQDINGVKSILYADIARDIFTNPGGQVSFCTDSNGL